ncbi:MAG TPA: sodium:solute symporter [Planctomycetes bacterium]|nr:sodium:solute symporter [Planctomycetota bacterium]
MVRRLVPLVLGLWLFGGEVWAEASAAGASQSPGSQRIEVGGIDLAIILVYLVGIVALGCWAGLRRKGAQGSDYFLAGKSLTWPIIGLALFATNISTIHLVSFAQNGYESGLVYGNYEWMAPFTLVLLSLFFAPFYIRSGVATLPDFMERRYSRASRDYLAVLSIFSAVMVHIGFSLYTGTIVLEGSVLQPLGVQEPEKYRFFTVLGICGATALYTIIGGLLAVVLTESIQTIVLLTGAVCITVLGLYMMGGWDGTWAGLVGVGQVVDGWRGVKANVHPGNISMIRPDTDPTGTSWYAVLLGYPVLGIWYWCTDQTIVQRVLGAKDENHARVGPLFAGFIKILPVLIFVIPGVICLALVNSGRIGPLPLRPDGMPDTEKAYSHLIAHVLPAGMRGIVVAALLAALMSTVSGALNSIATLFSYDIYKRFKPRADDRHLVAVGRVATFAAMCLAVAWTMAIEGQKSIFQMMVDVFPVVAPPTAVVFFWGVFWRRASATASLITLVGGSLVGLVLFVINYHKLNVIGEYEVGALLQAFILFVLESILLIVLSYVFPHRHTPASEALVWKSPLEALRGRNMWRGLGDYRLLALLLVVVMVGFYWWFAGEDFYYPVDGQVRLADGTPVVGARVYLETDDPRFNAALVTDAQGRYAYGTAKQVGGAPAGTRYRVRIEPAARDFVVRMAEGDLGKGAIAEVLAVMPPGTAVSRRVIEGDRQLVIQTVPPQTLRLEKGAHYEVLRATPVPKRYQRFETSGLELVVQARKNHVDFELAGNGGNTSPGR